LTVIGADPKKTEPTFHPVDLLAFQQISCICFLKKSGSELTIIGADPKKTEPTFHRVDLLAFQQISCIRFFKKKGCELTSSV